MTDPNRHGGRRVRALFLPWSSTVPPAPAQALSRLMQCKFFVDRGDGRRNVLLAGDARNVEFRRALRDGGSPADGRMGIATDTEGFQ